MSALSREYPTRNADSLCKCGDLLLEHSGGDGQCMAGECRCQKFEPAKPVAWDRVVEDKETLPLDLYGKPE